MITTIAIGDRRPASNNVTKLLTSQQFSGWEHTTKLNGGFESASFLYSDAPNMINYAYENWHFHKLRAYSRMKQLCWEGYIWSTGKRSPNVMEVSALGYWSTLNFLHYRPPGSLGATSYDTTENSTEDIGTTDIFLAQGFQSATAATIVEVWLKLKELEAPRGDMWVEIYSNNAVPTPDEPNAVITNGRSATRQLWEDLTGEYQWVKFAFPTAVSISAATQYWLVLKTSTSSIIQDGDTIQWAADSAGTYADGFKSGSTDRGSTWTGGETGVDLMFAVLATVQVRTVLLDVLSRVGTSLSAVEARIQNQNIATVIIPDESITGSEMIEFLLGFADDQATPRIWYAGVYDDRILSIFPRPTSVDYVVRGGRMDLIRSLDSVYNSIRVKYEVGSNPTETAYSTNNNPFSEFTRELEISVGEATSTRATSIQSAALEAYRQTVQKGSAIIDASSTLRRFAGAPAYPWMVRAGQVLRIEDARPIFPGAVGGLDARSTFVLTGTRYVADTGMLTVEFDFENPTLQALLLQAQRQETFERWTKGLFS